MQKLLQHTGKREEGIPRIQFTAIDVKPLETSYLIHPTAYKASEF